MNILEALRPGRQLLSLLNSKTVEAPQSSLRDPKAPYFIRVIRPQSIFSPVPAVRKVSDSLKHRRDQHPQNSKMLPRKREIYGINVESQTLNTWPLRCRDTDLWSIFIADTSYERKTQNTGKHKIDAGIQENVVIDREQGFDCEPCKNSVQQHPH